MTTLAGPVESAVNDPLHVRAPSVRDQFLDQLRLRASAPAVPTGFVHRPRLDKRLASGTTHPVTLVSAGPGYGKTLTVASWARSGNASGRLAWLTVDDTDNDLPAFWADVLGALTISGSVPAGSALRDVVPAAGFGAQQTHLVRAGLAGLPGPLTLILDDFHLIRDPAVLESVGQLLEHQPPQLRLVFATRTDPPLRLQRLRVNGAVTDIRAAELAFTPAEAAKLFSTNGIHLSPAQLRGVSDRTLGWPAGLRLALMGLDPTDIDNGIARFAGSTPMVAEYLIEEVLNRLPAVYREFLISTSIADRISASLAGELTGSRDAQLILERLAAEHALVVGLAGRNDWFSYHPLLREMLRYRLAAEQPDVVPELHARASRWFAARGEPIPAIRHAIRAQQWDELAPLIALGMPEMLTLNAGALVTALEPAAARARVEPTTSTLLAAAFGHFHRHDYEAMAGDTADAAELMTDVKQHYRWPAEIVTAVFQVVHARTSNPARIGSTADHLLDLVDRVPRRELPTAEQFRIIGINNSAIGQLWTGDLAAAEASLSLVQARSQQLGLGLVELSTQAHLAVLDVIHGRLPQAHDAACTARDVATRRGWTSEPQALGLYAAAAMTYLEWDQLDEADAQITAGLAVSDIGSDVALRLILGIAAAGVAVARGNPIAVRHAAAQLGCIRAQAGDLPPFLARWCTVAEAETHLAVGDPNAVFPLIGDTRESGGYPDFLERVVLAKARLQLHQPDAALALLDSVTTTSVTTTLTTTSVPFRGPMVEALALSAVAADMVHRDAAAMAAITDAVELAHSVGMIRPFRAAGPRIPALLTRHRHIIARHLDFTAKLGTMGNGETRSAGLPRPLAEPLTEREHTVLRYLPTMFKASEIAADLFVTVNTVKSHQQAIYRKLEVTTRHSAVDRARELNLL